MTQVLASLCTGFACPPELAAHVIKPVGPLRVLRCLHCELCSGRGSSSVLFLLAVPIGRSFHSLPSALAPESAVDCRTPPAQLTDTKPGRCLQLRTSDPGRAQTEELGWGFRRRRGLGGGRRHFLPVQLDLLAGQSHGVMSHWVPCLLPRTLHKLLQEPRAEPAGLCLHIGQPSRSQEEETT